MLTHTERVTIELSNLCNMAHIHKLCPLYEQKKEIKLSNSIIRKVFNFLAKNKYSGFVAFNNYNEPLMDERLIPLIKKLLKNCPTARPYMLTNGLLLNQKKLDKLTKAGLKKIYVSCYYSKEYKRLSTLKASIKYKAKRVGKLDARLDNYCTAGKPMELPCYSPLGEIVIRCTGDVVLCCMDWNSKYKFGNLYKESLEDILKKGEMKKVYKRLREGYRYFDICRTCRMKGRYER